MPPATQRRKRPRSAQQPAWRARPHPTQEQVNALFANVMTPEVTRQMILNRQHLAQGGSRPYGPATGVEPAVADYRRMHQPNLLPVPQTAAPPREQSEMGMLSDVLRAGETARHGAAILCPASSPGRPCRPDGPGSRTGSLSRPNDWSRARGPAE
jgi:hypothetical protein